MYVYIFLPNMKFLSLILWLGGLCTNADSDTTDANNYARRTNDDYTGSLGITPNERKRTLIQICLCNTDGLLSQ